MNRLFNFSTGTLLTFCLSSSLTPPEMENLLLNEIVSLVGGILSAILIAWLRKRWNDNNHSSPMV